MTRNKATMIGFSAVLMWAVLALLTILSAPVPPFLLNAVCFAIGSVIGLIWTARRGFGILASVSWKVYAFGTIGLFGYHFLYFSALRIAPGAETSLIAYLWPLFIVLLSGLLPGERLRIPHIIGALVAFAGAALIVLGREAGWRWMGFAIVYQTLLAWMVATAFYQAATLWSAPMRSVCWLGFVAVLTAGGIGLMHLYGKRVQQ